MATLALGTLLTLLDSVAKQVEVCRVAFGTGTEPGSISLGAANNVATITAVADVQVQADLSMVVQARAAVVQAGIVSRALYGAPLQRALDRHYGDVGGLGRFLQANGARVHPDLREIGFQIDPAQAFCPFVVTPVASFVVTAPGVGTFTIGTPINEALYGPAKMAIRTTTAIGAAAVTVTVTLQAPDGTTTTEAVVVPALTAAGVSFPLGVGLHVSCVGIDVVGGTAADAVAVTSVVERVVAL